tara:strand:- start:116 stop:1153 length:1038 start_codon:yes stop_codon:yes gene_type:complete
MNIKIATYFYGNNYGALLQCYYLKKFLEDNFKDKKIDFFKYQPKKLIFREEYSPILKKNPIKIIDGILRFRRLSMWKKKNISFKPIYEKYEDKVNKGISVYGSDEIWNFSNPFFGYDDFFFGKYDKNYKISYAASFGAANKEKLSLSIKKEINDLLNKFSYLSVRDEYSRNMLKKIFNIDSEIVLDPVFFNQDQLDKIKNKNEKDKCIIYGNFFSKFQIKKIIDYCKSKNLKIVSIGYYNNWAKSNIIMNPFEFLDEIKKSKIIFTSMFHGIQFGIKFKKNVWFSVDPYRANKLDYFLNKLNLKKREIKENSNFDEEIDYIKIEEIINNWKMFSKEFLINSINSR